MTASRNTTEPAIAGHHPTDFPTKETEMLLIQEALARSQQEERRREADRARRAARLASQRRWQRRAESASRRARALATSIDA